MNSKYEILFSSNFVLTGVIKSVEKRQNQIQDSKMYNRFEIDFEDEDLNQYVLITFTVMSKN